MSSVSDGDFQIGIDGGQSQLRLKIHGTDEVFVVPGVSHGEDIGARVRDAIVEVGALAGVTSCTRVVAGLTALPIDVASIEYLADGIAVALGAEEVWIADDTVTAHSAAFAGDSGIVLVVGTGIACFAVDSSLGRIHRTSGAGYLIGDEGGAYWVGRMGLAAAIKSFDGRAGQTTLLDMAVERFGTTPQDLAVRVHVDDRAVSVIADFAVDVISAAEAGDVVAREILDDAVGELASAIESCVVALPGSAHGGVALMGRLVSRSSLFSQLVMTAIARIQPDLQTRIENVSPLDGAVAMAYASEAGVYAEAIIARSTVTSRASKHRPGGSAANAYLSAARSTLLAASLDEREQISQAAVQVAKRLMSGGMIHTFGTGHSHMLAEELFYRAGGLARVDPLLIDNLMLHESASLSTEIERQPGLAERLLDEHPMNAGDVLIVVSNSGGNLVSIELAQRAQELDVYVIALTSMRHATSAKARSHGGPRLHEIADLVLDNHGVVGDAAVSIPGIDRRVGATSTVVGAALLQALATETVALLVDEGIDPEVFSSSNTAGGDEINRVLLDRYRNQVKSL